MIGAFQVGPFQGRGEFAFQQVQAVGGHGNVELDWLFNRKALDAKRLFEYRRRKISEEEQKQAEKREYEAKIEGLLESSRLEHERSMARAEIIRQQVEEARGKRLALLKEQQRRADLRAKAALARRKEIERRVAMRKEEDEGAEAVAFFMAQWDDFFPRRKH